jgi:hypothetical protein
VAVPRIDNGPCAVAALEAWLAIIEKKKGPRARIVTLPRWAGSIAVLIGAYVVVMLSAAQWLPHEWDWATFDWLSSRTVPTFDAQEVGIVDVPWEPSNSATNRRRLAAFLDALVASKQQPKALILDVEFDPCQSTPCGEPMESARRALVASIRSAERFFPVYAVEQPVVDRDDDATGLDRKDPEIYGALSGAGHTRFTTIPNSTGLFYRVCYDDVPLADETVTAQAREELWDMVERVMMTPSVFAGATCDTNHLPVRFDPKATLAAPVIATLLDGRAFPGDAQFDQKYVIAGTLKYDRSPFTKLSGPELLGWALSNVLDRASSSAVRTYYDTQPQNGMLLVLVPAFSALTTLAFIAVFYLLKGRPMRALRRALPWLAGALGAALGLSTFLAFEVWMLHQRQIQPQVTLISLGILLAAALSAVRAFQVLFEEQNRIDPTPGETYDYDVFISYAHEEGAWVSEHVYMPLRDARLPDGAKLSIFFDTSSIRSGVSWQDKISLAIDGSRFVVPVYSEIYFKKPYCRFEIKRAHRKWIAAGEESSCVLPVMRGHLEIYRTVDDIQAQSIDDVPNLVQQHVAQIVDQLSRRSRRTGESHLPIADRPPAR